MVLIYRVEDGFSCVLPKRILSKGKTYTFKEPLPDDEAFQDRFFGLWEKSTKNAKVELVVSAAKLD
jgi:hypothetical protein